jgi:cobalamin transport system substrate-binding protein
MLKSHWRRRPWSVAVAAVASAAVASAAVASAAVASAAVASAAAAGLLFAVPAAAAAPSGHAGSFPATVHAANGTVTVSTRPTAIVSLSPTATEMLYAIGAGSQVKAVDQDSDYPPTAPHSSLDGNNPNVEAIASYKPDLVVASDESSSLDSQLRALGIPVLSDPAATNLAQEYRQFEQLGTVTGHQAQARAEVVAIEHQISHIVASVHKPAHHETYYYELDQTYYSATSSTFIGQVLGLLGLRSIADAAKGAAASGGYPQLSGEYVVKANPDYIILADTVCCHQTAATVAQRPGWSGLAAVRHHRIIALNDDIASRWGPRVVDLLSQVAAALHAHPVSGSS